MADSLNGESKDGSITGSQIETPTSHLLTQMTSHQRTLEKKIDELHVTPIELDRLRILRGELQAMLSKRFSLTTQLERLNSPYAGSKGRSQKSSADYNYESLFLNVFDQLAKDKKIKYISENLYESFGLRDYLCRQEFQCRVKSEPSCKRLKAFYLPLVDQIFVDPSLSGGDLTAAIFHEVQHAFQYRFRFPLDMAFLINLATLEKPQVKREDILSYLSLIYETQSSWYEMQGHLPRSWMDVLSVSSKLSYYPTRLFHALISSGWHWARLLVPGETGSMPGLKSFNDLLPIEDKLPIAHNGLPATYPAGEPNALYFKELVLFGRPEVLNFVGNLDIGFHKRLTQSIECNYYGKLNFLFETMSGNQALVTQAHNLFYMNFLDSKSTSPIQCARELQMAFEQSQLSPFTFWMSNEPSKIPSACRVAFDFWQKPHQDFAVSIYTTHENSPFNLMARGVEGGTGGFGLNPKILFNPQLELSPLPLPKAELSPHQGNQNEY